MKKAKPTKPRVVLSLHMPHTTHESVAAAAELSGESVAAFIRSAAEKRAERVADTERRRKAGSKAA